VFDLSVEPEQNIELLDDYAHDDDTRAEIIKRLDDGDAWAFGQVTVKAIWRGFVGESHLGCCSYRDAKDFKVHSGYWKDKKREALRSLNTEVMRHWKNMEALFYPKEDDGLGNWYCEDCKRDWGACLGDDEVPETCPDCHGRVRENTHEV